MKKKNELEKKVLRLDASTVRELQSGEMEAAYGGTWRTVQFSVCRACPEPATFPYEYGC